MCWRGAMLVAVLAACCLFPSNALAHAELIGSDPPAGASLDQAPSEISLYFSEAVAPGLTEIALLDSRGRRIDRVQSRIDGEGGRRLSAPVDDLPPGVYTVSYRALSAIDGHIDRGVVSFAVGTTESIAGQNSSEVLRQPQLWTSSVLRWFSYLAVLLLLGLSAFRVFTAAPRVVRLASSQRQALDHALAGLVCVSGLVLMLSSIAQLLQQAADLAQDATLGALLNSIETLIVRTRYGAIWIARITLGLAVLSLLRAQHSLPESERSQRWGGAVILSGLALYTFAALSHSASALDGSWIGVLLSWLHLASIAVWFGGAIALTVSMRVGVLREVVARFSRLSLVAFGAIVVSGFGESLLLVGDPRVAAETLSGQLLMGKLIVVVGILLFAWRARRATASLHVASTDSSLGVERGVCAEIRLAALVLGITAVLVYLPPAWQTYQQQLRGRPLELESVAQGLVWSARIEPGRPGMNEITLRPPDELWGRGVSGRLVATFQDDDLPPVGAKFDLTETGDLQVRSSMLSVAGRWLLESVVRLDSGEDVLVRLPLELAGPGTPVPPPPILRGGAWTASILVSVALAVLGLGLLVFVVRTLGTRSGEARGLIAATLAIMLLGVYVAIRPAPSSAVTSLDLRRSTSPIEADAASVTRGREIYTRVCAECHGSGGRGDGSRTAARGERLTDLRVHLTAGHTDGDLFYWVSNGINGTEMPAFASELSEDDRWHVVNAVRAITAAPSS